MISEKDVLHIASLARIHLEPDEIRHLTHELENILHYVQKLKDLNTADIEPTSHALDLKNVFRQDIIQPSLKQADVLKLAVEHYKNGFKVPKVIE